jgi:hypothetical protein
MDKIICWTVIDIKIIYESGVIKYKESGVKGYQDGKAGIV